MIGAPLLIAGCPRSGTSLTSRAFMASGVWAGGVTSLAENGSLKMSVLKPILRAGGMDDLGLRSFADCDADPAWIRASVERIITAQGYKGGPWLFKDVKLVFCWRAWADAFPDATWATVWRGPEQILASFDRWAMRGRVSFDGERVVREHHSRAEQIPAMRLYPDALFDGDDSAYLAVCERVGVTWDRDAVASVVDPDRYHAA